MPSDHSRVQPDPSRQFGLYVGDEEGQLASDERVHDKCSTCGNLGHLFIEPSDTFTTTRWTYVGQGRGQYDEVPFYSYVGHGEGDYEKERRDDAPRQIRPVCFLCFPLCVIVLAFILLAVLDRSSSSPSSAPSKAMCASTQPLELDDMRDCCRLYLTRCADVGAADEAAAGPTPSPSRVSGMPLPAGAAPSSPVETSQPPLVSPLAWQLAAPVSSAPVGTTASTSSELPTPPPAVWLSTRKPTAVVQPFVPPTPQPTTLSPGVLPVPLPPPVPPPTLAVAPATGQSRAPASLAEAAATAAAAAVPVPPASNRPYDCAEDWGEWRTKWSVVKAGYCCQHVSKGCATDSTDRTNLAYDCRSEFATFQISWSQARKSWCCEKVGKGCSES